ncbi:MAG: anthranilate phosphoribosyltransferase [Phycisphaerales bacterium]
MQEIARLIAGHRLSENHAESLFERLLTGSLDEAQIGAVLALLQCRGVTTDELVGAARVMRRHVERVPYTPAGEARLIDTCGTGGAPKTFNVSTAAAIVAAGADRRLRVAKHGNRSRTGRGSAEVLAALGVDVDAPPEAQAECLRNAGVCFCFAIHHHPAMRHAAGARRSLGVPTVFNLLGPLTNPAGATRQLIGVYEPAFVPLMAETLARLGAEHALVVHSREGLDEIGLADATDAAEVTSGGVRRLVIEPWTLGLERTPRENLVAESVDEAARLIEAVLSGQPGPPRDIVLVNAAAAIWVAGIANNLEQGLALARQSIDSGAARSALDRLREGSASP